jgi:hypothetical protein
MHKHLAARLLLAVAVIGLVAQPGSGQNKPHSLWAAVTVPRPVFVEGQGEQPSLTFAIVNDGATTVNPMFGPTRLFINGSELKAWDLISSNGPKTSDHSALPPGHFVEFGYDFGAYFKKPGIYTVRWESPQFSPARITFRVVPKNH